MKPDVIVQAGQDTMLFQPQNRRASEWLRGHYHLSTESANSKTRLRVHPTRSRQIIEELKGAGFTVINGENEA
jgi:hypothetical protein